jgi:two-component system cell cycle sensor histidine kinase/response regulator CckA
VQHHEGFVSLNSKVDHGTSFTVFLRAAESARVLHTKTKTTQPMRGKGELIMVVDDEEPVRLTVSAILSSHGYKTGLACDGAEAISVFTSRVEEVKLLLTDIQMPFLNGWVLSTALHWINPDLPVVAMSGAGSHANAGHKDFATTFIAKPFLAETLLSIVRLTLDKTTPASSPQEKHHQFDI